MCHFLDASQERRRRAVFFITTFHIRRGTWLFTYKQEAVRLVYQLRSGGRCVCNPQTLPASDDFNIHTWPLLGGKQTKTRATSSTASDPAVLQGALPSETHFPVKNKQFVLASKFLTLHFAQTWAQSELSLRSRQPSQTLDKCLPTQRKPSCQLADKSALKRPQGRANLQDGGWSWRTAAVISVSAVCHGLIMQRDSYCRSRSS